MKCLAQCLAQEVMCMGRVALERAWRCSLGSSLEDSLGHGKEGSSRERYHRRNLMSLLFGEIIRAGVKMNWPRETWDRP